MWLFINVALHLCRSRENMTFVKVLTSFWKAFTSWNKHNNDQEDLVAQGRFLQWDTEVAVAGVVPLCKEARGQDLAVAGEGAGPGAPSSTPVPTQGCLGDRADSSLWGTVGGQGPGTRKPPCGSRGEWGHGLAWAVQASCLPERPSLTPELACWQQLQALGTSPAPSSRELSHDSVVLKSWDKWKRTLSERGKKKKKVYFFLIVSHFILQQWYLIIKRIK